MNVLMISRDENIVKDGSDAQTRMKEYGALADELHIIVFTTGIMNRESGIRNKKIAENILVYPTYSRSKWLYGVDAYTIAKRIIKNPKFPIHNSLITCQDPFEAGLAGWCAARKFGIPLQLQMHTDLFSPYFKNESLVNWIRVCMAKFLIPRASGIRVVSERIKNSLKAKSYTLKAEPIVLPIFVDTEKIKNAPIKTDLHKKYPQFDFIALMASRFTREKNIPMAISAMAEVVKKHPKAGLVIVGNGPEKKNYETLIEKYCLEKNIMLENWTDDLASYYKTADVFVLTSNYEGYGRTPIEAEAAGCPVIMTDVGIAGEIVKHGENGLVVPVGGTQALAEALISVVEKKTIVQASLPAQPTKEVYMEAYKQTWKQCIQK